MTGPTAVSAVLMQALVRPRVVLIFATPMAQRCVLKESLPDPKAL